MDNDSVDYRQLIDELCITEGGCVTAVAGADADEVIRRFGGDPERADRQMGLEDFWSEDDETCGERDLIAVAQAGPAVAVVEGNGIEGSREEVLRGLSRLGRTASAFWSVDAMSQLALAEDGLVLSAFEMLFPDVRHGSRPEAWDPYLEGLAFGRGWERGDGIRAVARATGARLDHGLAAGAFRIVEITPVRSNALPQGLEDSPLLREEPFRRYAADLGPHLVPEMEHHAFTLALQHSGLADDPLANAFAAEILRPSADPAVRPRLRGQAALAKAEAERNGGGPPACPATPQAAFWYLMDFLLATPGASRACVFFLQQVMTGKGELVDRYWLLNTLHGVAQKGG